MDPWSKWRLKWITPTLVTGILLDEPIAPAAAIADVYQLLSGTATTGEYFLVENRQFLGFDAGLPGSGLLLWHVDTTKLTNQEECYPGGPSCVNFHYRVAVVQADGLYHLEQGANRGDPGDPWPGSTGKQVFDDASTPSSRLYNGGLSGASVSDITIVGNTITATLAAGPRFALTVTKAGGGSGTVTSDPARIACGGACSAEFEGNTGVILTATATAESAFTGWSGEGCTGTGICTVAMTQARSVTATFERKAAITSPAPESTLGGSSATFTWSAGSGAAQYWLDIGTTPGGTNVYTKSQGTATSTTVSGLPGGSVTLYVRLWTRFGTGWQFSDYTYTAASTGGSKAAMSSPANGSTLPAESVTFTWDPGSGGEQYWLDIGTTPGGTNVYTKSQGTATSATVSGLPGGSVTLYVRLWTRFGTAWQFADYTFTAAATGASKAAMTSPGNGTTLPGVSVTFTWDPGSGGEQYWLDIGTTPGGTNVYTRSQGLATSVTVDGLPSGGVTVYVRLWTRFGTAWQFADYSYTGMN
jgi:hypothetical protein